ncbi:hypothetical protein KP79_PYT23041 [Mizuhopecten yessoensis]|uniref:Tyr recombinase domain-containing protein n=1 Tax=Mizuhopecten yessoensis TaxID=6573 RepID=A0A210PH76_MIZYE|nr:hypothetical protein KP79_PYT23041 [Mizuhopecten yessoensis]
MTREGYCLARNYLIFVLLIRNAQRSGAVANLQLSAVENATKKGTDYILTVPEHKTGYSTPVYLVVSPSVYDYLHVYLKMRTKIPCFSEESNRNDTYVFLSWSPRVDIPPIHMNGSRVNRAINDFWMEAGMTTPLSATRIRKSTVTTVRDKDPNIRDKLAAHMNHSTRTADTYYYTHRRYDDAMDVSNRIASIMCVEPQPQEILSVPQNPNDAIDHDELDLGAEETVAEEETVVEEDKVVEEETEKEMKPNPNPNYFKLGGRRSFSREEQQCIFDIFEEYIESSEKPLNQRIAREELVKSVAGKQLLDKFQIKQLVDRVRTSRRTKKKK